MHPCLHEMLTVIGITGHPLNICWRRWITSAHRITAALPFCEYFHHLEQLSLGIAVNKCDSWVWFPPCRDPVNQAKQSKQRLLEQIQSHRFQEWNQEPGPEIHCHNKEWPSQMQFFSPNLDSRKHKLTGFSFNPFILSASLQFILFSKL